MFCCDLLGQGYIVFSLSIYTALSRGYDAARVLFSSFYFTFHYICSISHILLLLYALLYFSWSGSPSLSLSLSLKREVKGVIGYLYLYVWLKYSPTYVFQCQNSSVIACKTNPISAKVSSITVTGHMQQIIGHTLLYTINYWIYYVFLTMPYVLLVWCCLCNLLTNNISDKICIYGHM